MASRAIHLFVSHFIVCICGLCCFAPCAMLMHSVVRCYGQLVCALDCNAESNGCPW